MELKGKIAVVTGGSSGIGQACVMALAQAGCHVIFTYNSKKEEAEKIQKDTQNLGVNSLYLKMDLHVEKEVVDVFEKIKQEFGQVDILINNAGINQPRDLFDTKVWKEVFQVNLFSLVLSTQKAVELMKNGGRIIHITSIYGEGKACGKGLAAYGASKAAVNHFTQTLAKNLAPRILVNAIAPGYVKTPLWKDTSEEQFAESGKDQLIERMISPSEIAEMVLAVAKNDAMTGEVVVVDGGLSLKTV